MANALDLIANIDTSDTTVKELWGALQAANKAGVGQRLQGCDFVKESKYDMVAVVEGIQSDIAYGEI